MFEQFVDNCCKMADMTIHMQQELFKKWVSMLPTASPSSTVVAGPLAIQNKGLEIASEFIKKECETFEAQINAGLRNIEEAFQLVKAKDAEELRAKTVELWQKGFETLKQTSETQVRDFKSAAAKWTEVLTKGGAA
jgi:hypothetical protein